MTDNKKTNLFCIMIGLFSLIFDQATKFAILAFIPSGSVVPICPCFNLVLTFNFGTSFGLLSPNSAFQSFLIILMTFACMAFLTYMFVKLKTLVEKLLCSILIGGAIGNLLDRFIHGAVVDFMDFYYQNWHWPAFNFADVFISCSVSILVIYNLFSKNA